MRKTAKAFVLEKSKDIYVGCVVPLLPRTGHDFAAARQMAANINSQLENNIPAALSFQPISM